MMVEKNLPERLRPLEELAHNLWWCWNPGARDLFEEIDPDLWNRSERNPIAFLDLLTINRLKELERDESFLASLDAVYAQFKSYMSEKPDPATPKIAYFSMEYGLHASLKIYSGGLGILAGDYLKEASDKNVPMVAVGLLYRYGYFTQKLSAQGAQEATYEAQNFSKLPIQPVRDAVGNWATVSIPLPGRTLTARIWLCRVGRTDLYLLDADYEANLEEDRRVTHYLYGGDWENRLKQEILLGIGGVRALQSAHIAQDVSHCNEGHAAFLGLERIRNLVMRRRLTFAEALEVVRSSSLFTTHTPVPAGHDAFPEAMIRQYLSHYPEELGIDWAQFVGLGRVNPEDPNEKFSMSVLACNLSQEVNGVSLHGEVSKEILGDLWPGYFKNELHIGYVTNGVHFPTWTATRLRRLYARYFPEGFGGTNIVFRSGRRCTTSRTKTLAGAHGAQREARSPDPPPLLRSRAGAHGFAPSGHAGAREHQARCAEDRFCAPFRHLQTGVAALHRSGSPGGHRQQQGASRAVYLCGQGASQRSAGTGSHQADHRSRDHAAVLRQDHLPAELRHGAGASPGAGRGRVAQYPYSSARGVGYVG